MDWHDLMKMKVTELRDLAKERTQIEGVTGLAKEDLVEELAKALGIPKPHKVIEKGLGKRKIKAEIRKLKAARDAAIAGKDRAALDQVRQQIHSAKRKLHRMAHVTH